MLRRMFNSLLKGRNRRGPARPALRSSDIETLEERRVFDADPIQVGATYTEEDASGGDDHGDTFHIKFDGGAAGTELKQVIIDGDQIGNFGNILGLSNGDVFFDTQLGGLGADGAFPFKLISANGIDSYTVTVIDGGTRLQIDFEGFNAGEEFIFSIDVDEVIIYDPNDPNNTLIDPVSSGAEVQGTQFIATFSAEYYHDTTITTKFLDAYDSKLAASGLDLPADNATGHRDRTDGAFGSAVQQPLPVTISGRVYHDVNLSLTQEAGEVGLSGVSLTLWMKVNGVYVNTGYTTTTNAQGDYEFGVNLNLQPGTYQVRETQPSGYFSVGAIPGTVSGTSIGSIVAGDKDILTEITIVNGGTSAIHYDFAEALPAQLSGYVYHDRDNDGVKETGEEGIAGVTLTITGIDVDGVTRTYNVTTNSVGYYEAKNLPPGMYTVTEVQPATYIDGIDAAGTVNGSLVGAAVNPGDQILNILLLGGQSGINYNFGEIKPASISGSVHLTDRDGNCYDGVTIITPPIEGVKIELLDAGGNVIATTTTDANGQYSFGNLLPGTYSVREYTPVGLIDGGDHVGTVNGTTNGANSSNDLLSSIVLLSGDDGVNYDFCEHEAATIAGYVYHDRDNDGVKESGEEGIAGVTVILLDSNGVQVGTTTTAADGSYKFTGLSAGNYQIVETQPTNYLDGLDAAGTIGGTIVGAATNPGDKISAIELKWGDDGINYNFGEIKPVSISGYVYHDLDNDGVKETGEAGISGVTVQVINSVTNQIFSVTTDNDGYYEVVGLPPGTYRIVETQPVLYTDGKDAAGTVGGSTRGSAVNPGDQINSISLVSGDTGINYNFGEILPGSISGRVHLTDKYGDCDSEEAYNSPIEGAIVKLYDAAGNLIAETTTDANGDYTFDGLLPGTYTVVEITPAGLIDGGDHVGTIGGVAVGQNSANDTLSSIIIRSGDHGINYDFCEHEPAKIGGFVYHDRNNDGVMDAGEEGIAGAIVYLYDSTGALIGTQTTAADGSYMFTGLRADTYRIVEKQPTGYLDGKDAAGTVGGVTIGTATNPGDEIKEVTLLWGDEGINYKFGEVKPGSIGGYVWSDTDDDCLFDANEKPISGVTIKLLDAAGNVIATTKTDANGHYLFNNLLPGLYTVVETQPAGYFQGHQMDLNGLADDSVQDTISRINITSGLDLDNHNFCELPPATISGYVYQDGATFTTTDGNLPADALSQRDGTRTSDDTPIGGVTLELRDGITGLPIMGNDPRILGGTYGSGPVRVVTDADGYYQFVGLQAGFYAVFEVHPDGYGDGNDNAGTTAGVAFNQGNGVSVGTLLVDPLNDMIALIDLPVGAHSQENNFSELKAQGNPPVLPPVPPVPAGTLDPLVIPVAPPPAELIPPAALFIVQPLLQGYSGGATGVTWHLSVVNAGLPRSKDQIAFIEPNVWFTAANDSILPWEGNEFLQAEWKLQLASAGDNDEEEILIKLFGMPGAHPVSGDFNGDGVTDFGIYYKGHWYIDVNGNGVWDEEDLWAKLGYDGDLPVVGDWDGDGKDDIGIYGKAWPGDPRAVASDPGLPVPNNVSTGISKNLPPKPDEATLGSRVMKLTSTGKVRSDLIDHVFHFGTAGNYPVVGDWDGDGIQTIGVFQDGEWRLDEDGNGRWDDEVDSRVKYGKAGDVPVVGDWNGDGIDELGIFHDGQWTLDHDNNRHLDDTDKVFMLGEAGDLPTVGDWDGDGYDEVGVYHGISGQPRVSEAPGPLKR
ncbi:carboxypeptidase regulatory-like domain-containing protein [Blastopirellula sp. JC732]|uniref:Carboxypeptidase regulatory-like domain-containing protein n=1 Tax=Blastopirellula sediminis TaxID=2894196 RepID=A0A9X1MP23_9BACT|nr:SdrD B-like domain-containing protein [Blastopirellula sediminis]MCC9609755.1 carboxypeptidase regulatory-like domain-containing protein [Blastopirellula sediminis]MCC9628999.1 carboxypeptidase regulatory-like domain-containing protein [Blastopirellula sediminis]